jgi:hypothetical protein
MATVIFRFSDFSLPGWDLLAEYAEIVGGNLLIHRLNFAHTAAVLWAVSNEGPFTFEDFGVTPGDQVNSIKARMRLNYTTNDSPWGYLIVAAPLVFTTFDYSDHNSIASVRFGCPIDQIDPGDPGYNATATITGALELTTTASTATFGIILSNLFTQQVGHSGDENATLEVEWVEFEMETSTPEPPFQITIDPEEVTLCTGGLASFTTNGEDEFGDWMLVDALDPDPSGFPRDGTNGAFQDGEGTFENDFGSVTVIGPVGQQADYVAPGIGTYYLYVWNDLVAFGSQTPAFATINVVDCWTGEMAAIVDDPYLSAEVSPNLAAIVDDPNLI